MGKPGLAEEVFVCNCQRRPIKRYYVTEPGKAPLAPITYLPDGIHQLPVNVAGCDAIIATRDGDVVSYGLVGPGACVAGLLDQLRADLAATGTTHHRLRLVR